jgi:hypothetical protein
VREKKRKVKRRKERGRECALMFVCAREKGRKIGRKIKRGSESERMCVCVREREGKGESVCVCLSACVCGRGREGKIKRGRDIESM